MGKILKAWTLVTLVLTSTAGHAAFLKDYVIWDPDPNHSSGPLIDAALKSLGYCGDYEPGTACDFSSNYTFTQYAAIFVCLGVSPNSYVFGNQPCDTTVDSSLFSYLSFTNPPDTPHIYMEGADTWCYDPWLTVHPMFRVDLSSCNDGFNDADMISGVAGTCMAGLSFQYTGENNWMDRLTKATLAPPDTAVYLFENSPTIYYNAVGYRPGNRQYVSIASAFEFGGIDSPMQTSVMDAIMNCFFERPPGSFATDGAALRVVEPGPYSAGGVPLVPEIEVKNNGTSIVQLTGRYLINPGGSTCSVTIPNLNPNETRIVPFPCNWIPGALCTSYDVTMWVELAGDMNGCNDTTTSSTLSWDAGFVMRSPYSTTAPTIDGIINSPEWASADTYYVSDILGRGGTGPASCNSAILLVKNDSSNIYFGMDANGDATFDDYDTYTLFFEDNYDRIFSAGNGEGRVRLTTYSPGSNPDTVYFLPYSPCAGTEALAPSLQGNANFNTGNVQYELRIPINPGGNNAQLNANLGDTVGFWFNAGDFFSGSVYSWWPTLSTFDFGSLCPDASLMGDLILGVGGAVLDAGTVTVLSPPDTVCPDSCYTPEVSVQNFGGLPTGNFYVVLTIAGGSLSYAESVLVSLPPSGVDTAIFPQVCLPSDTNITYNSLACSRLAGDVNSNNDCSASATHYATSLCGAFHDVGLADLDVILPPGVSCVIAGDTVYVDVTAENFGNYYTETFQLTCYTRPPSYNNNTNVPNLAPGIQTSLTLMPPWVISPSDTGCFDVIVKVTGVPGDVNPSNDSLVLVDTVCVCVGVEEGGEEVQFPSLYSLNQSRPNPTGGMTEIRYGLPLDVEMDLSIYDITGRLVVTLAQGKQSKGYYRTLWNGKDSLGKEVRTGIYFYRLKAGDFLSTRKLVVLR